MQHWTSVMRRDVFTFTIILGFYCRKWSILTNSAVLSLVWLLVCLSVWRAHCYECVCARHRCGTSYLTFDRLCTSFYSLNIPVSLQYRLSNKGRQYQTQFLYKYLGIYLRTKNASKATIAHRHSTYKVCNGIKNININDINLCQPKLDISENSQETVQQHMWLPCAATHYFSQMTPTSCIRHPHWIASFSQCPTTSNVSQGKVVSPYCVSLFRFFCLPTVFF